MTVMEIIPQLAVHVSSAGGSYRVFSSHEHTLPQTICEAGGSLTNTTDFGLRQRKAT